MGDQISEKVNEYSKFVADVLRPDLGACLRAVDAARREAGEYRELVASLADLRRDAGGSLSSLRPLVDLGHGKVYCEAIVEHAATLFVHVGMGFHAELTIDEAITFVGKRLEYLDGVMGHHQDKARLVKDHVAFCEAILDQLRREVETS